MTTDAPNSAKLFSVDVCPNCAYSLTGLPPAGRCPECGLAYDQSVIILYGWGLGAHASISTSSRGRAIWYVVLVGLFFVIPLNSSHWHGAHLAMFALAIYGVLEAAYLWSRRGGDHPGLVQVRIGEQGVTQYDDLNGPSALREWEASHQWAIPLVMIPFSIVLFGVKGPYLPYMALLAIALLVGLLRWKRCAQLRHRLRQYHEGSIVDYNSVFNPVVFWQEVTDFKVQKLAEGRFRVYAMTNSFYRLGNVVDADVKCTHEQAAEIENLAANWRGKR